MLFNLDFAKILFYHDSSSFFLIIDSYFLIASVITQIPTKEATAEMETRTVIV